MRSRKITVLRLSGCSYCEELIRELNIHGIEYTSFDAEEVPDYADEVEEKIGTNAYPIVILEIGKLAPFYIFRAEDYNDMGESSLGDAVKIGTISINSMVEIILNLI